MWARPVSLLLRPTRPPVWLGWLSRASFIVAESVLVLLLKQVAPGNAFGGGVSGRGSGGLRGLGIRTCGDESVASAVAFDYFRNGPADFTLTRAENLTVIGIFLAVALVANTLAHLARTRAVEAELSHE